MKNRNRWIGIGGCALLLLWVAATTSAQGPDKRDRTDGMDRMAARLELTADQRTRIEAIHEKEETAARDLRKEQRRAEHALDGLLLEDQPNAKRLREAVEKVGAIRTQMRWQHFERQLAVREILTPEQRDLLPMRGEGKSHGMRGREGRRHGDRGLEHGRHHPRGFRGDDEKRTGRFAD
jgi:Spy/CpxP family protein refolding chaperone